MNIWEIFPNLTEATKSSHDERNMVGTGHDFDHALQVAQVATMIAEDERTGRLAGAAGLCHDADRLLQKELGIGKEDVPDALVEELVREWLAVEEFSVTEKETILDAVLRHSGLNQADDGPVLIALMDADRIVCSGAEGIMTATAFWRELPVLDPKWLTHDPEAHSYNDPRSILRNLECRFDWVDPASSVCVRLPKAKQMMEERVAFLRAYIERIERERVEAGLWPYYPVLNST